MINTTHYRLAKNTAWAVIPFGPLFTLDQAMAYLSDLHLGGFHNVCVVNVNEGQSR